jgi:hypothetical protein
LAAQIVARKAMEEYSMKYVWMVAVLMCVVLTSSAFAQFTPRQLGMGNAAIAVADDGAAWFQNPAGLGGLNLACEDKKAWANDVIGSYIDSANNGLDLTWSGWQPKSAMGFGAGVMDIDNFGKFVGAGFGMNVKKSPFSLGANIIKIDPDLGDSQTRFNLGLLYKFAVANADPIRAGLVLEDLTDESSNGPFLHAGVAWPVNKQLMLAMDIIDVTDEVDTTFNFGGEFLFGQQYEWAVRGGLRDGDLTLGAGYAFDATWRLDAAFADTDGDNILSIGAGLSF